MPFKIKKRHIVDQFCKINVYYLPLGDDWQKIRCILLCYNDDTNNKAIINWVCDVLNTFEGVFFFLV